MESAPAPKVLELEMFEGGAKITFDDRVCAVYPRGASLRVQRACHHHIMSDDLDCTPETTTQKQA